jgi:hypothetical protein
MASYAKGEDAAKPGSKLMPLKLPARSKTGGGGAASTGLNLGGDLGGMSLGGGLGSFGALGGDLGGLGGVDYEDEGEVDEQVWLQHSSSSLWLQPRAFKRQRCACANRTPPLLLCVPVASGVHAVQDDCQEERGGCSLCTPALSWPTR